MLVTFLYNFLLIRFLERFSQARANRFVVTSIANSIRSSTFSIESRSNSIESLVKQNPNSSVECVLTRLRSFELNANSSFALCVFCVYLKHHFDCNSKIVTLRTYEPSTFKLLIVPANSNFVHLHITIQGGHPVLPKNQKRC
jgi:hypothetical protein